MYWKQTLLRLLLLIMPDRSTIGSPGLLSPDLIVNRQTSYSRNHENQNIFLTFLTLSIDVVYTNGQCYYSTFLELFPKFFLSVSGSFYLDNYLC